MLTLKIILVAGALMLLAEIWRSHRQQRRATELGAAPPELAQYPSVTVIRPIKGLDAGARQNIEAALDHGYPGEVETLFVFDDEHEPAVPLARTAIRHYKMRGGKDVARIVYCGPPPAGRTGKLNAMIRGLREARGVLVAFADSDIRPGRKALKTLVGTLLSEPGAGAAFAPVVVNRPTRTAGDAGYAMLLNGLYGPAAAAVTRNNNGALPFIMGQFMVFKREALDAIGGLQTAEGQLVDDMYIGMRVHAAGYKNVVSPRRVPVIQGGLPFKEFWSVFLRWITFSRSGLPGREFKLISWLRGVTYWVGLAGGLIAGMAGFPLAAALLLGAPVAVAASIASLHERFGGAPLPLRHAAMAFVVFLVAPAIYASILFKREVSWRGRRYALGHDSRLSEGRALAADEGLAVESGTAARAA